MWAAYLELQRILGKGGVFGALDEFGLDALVMPSSIASPWAAPVGAPIVSVPMGHYPDNQNVTMDTTGELVTQGPGMPFGLSFMGRRWDEETLISLAYGFESVNKVRGRTVQRVVEPKAEVCDFGCR